MAARPSHPASHAVLPTGRSGNARTEAPPTKVPEPAREPRGPRTKVPEPRHADQEDRGPRGPRTKRPRRTKRLAREPGPNALSRPRTDDGAGATQGGQNYFFLPFLPFLSFFDFFAMVHSSPR